MVTSPTPSSGVEITPRTLHMQFGSLEIAYDDRVLRPRPWTKQQALWAAELMMTAPPGPVLEIFCGAGQIGLLAVAATQRSLVCVDIDPIACGFAEHNARAAGLHDRVEVREGSFADVLHRGDQFAVVIADPPWVRRVHVERYPEDPVRAIDGGDDGLDLARRCLAATGQHLLPGGSAVLQVGTRAQVETLRSELVARERGLQIVEVRELGGGVLARLDRMPSF